MHHTLAHRLSRLEQQALARDLPAWAEVDAVERICGHAVATLATVLHSQDLPASDEAQAQGDRALFEHWCREHGTYVDPEGARARLQSTLKTIAARYAADLPQYLIPISTLSIVRHCWQL